MSRDVPLRRVQCLILLAIVIPAGLLWRLAPLHLPQFAFKYGGSALWALAVYGVVALLRPRVPPAGLALRAAAIATGVELLKLLYWSPLDRFRQTLAGKLLLGRFFTLGALVTYWTALAAVFWLDLRMGSRSAEPCPCRDQVRG